MARVDTEGGDLAAAAGDVGEAGGAEAGQAAGHFSAENIRREIDQHVSHPDAVRRVCMGKTSRRIVMRSWTIQALVAFAASALSSAASHSLSEFSQPECTPVPPYSSLGLSTKSLRRLRTYSSKPKDSPSRVVLRVSEQRGSRECVADQFPFRWR